MLRANYSIEKKTDEWILLRDNYTNENPTMTITNDVENVILDLYKHHNILNKIIYYIDTKGEVDILQHDNFGNFKGFTFAYESEESFYENHK